MTGDVGGFDAAGHRRVEEPGAVEVQGQPARVTERPGEGEVVHGERLAGLRVLEAQQPGTCEVVVVGLDGRRDRVEIERAVGLEGNGLWLDRAERRGAPALEPVRVRGVPGDVLVAALAVTQ